MQLNKGLNLDAHPSIVETGDFRYAENIMLDSTSRFPINEKGLKSLNLEFEDICGTIPYDKGIVLFANTNYIYVVNTNVSPEIIIKTLYIPQIEFLKTHPIRGTYSYNKNNDLIICFSSGVNGNFEDKIINIDYYNYSELNYYQLTDKDFYKLDLNPNIVFPEINNSIVNGNLMSGSYQISISYYLDKEYTNHSLLSLPVYIHGSEDIVDGEKKGLSPNSISTKGIRYVFKNLDKNYDYYRISVIYNNGTNFTVYLTSKINTYVDNYIIDDISKLTKGSLDDTLINSIFYSNSESMNVMNNKLYRANLKSPYNKNIDVVATEIADKLILTLENQIIDKSDISETNTYLKFQDDEVYALYLTIGDKKGNVIGSYPITSENVEGGLEIISNNDLASINNIINKLTLKQTNSLTNTVTVDILETQVEHSTIVNKLVDYPVTLSVVENLPQIQITAGIEFIAETDLTIPISFKYVTTEQITYTYVGDIFILAGNTEDVTIITVDDLPNPNYSFFEEIYLNSIELIFSLEQTLPYDSVATFTFFKNGNQVLTTDVIILKDIQGINKKYLDYIDYDTYSISTLIYNKYDISINLLYNLISTARGTFNLFGETKDFSIEEGTKSISFTMYNTTSTYTLTWLDGIDFTEIYYELSETSSNKLSISSTIVDSKTLNISKIFLMNIGSNISNKLLIQYSSPLDDTINNVNIFRPVYHIPTCKTLNNLSENDSIVYTTNDIKITLPLKNSLTSDLNYVSEFESKISFWCIHKAQRNNTNSKIYTQGILMSKPHIYNPGINSTNIVVSYLQNDDDNPYPEFITAVVADLYSFYSFEDLFSKNDNFPSRIEVISLYDFKLYSKIYSSQAIEKLYITGEKILSLDYLSYKTTILSQGNSYLDDSVAKGEFNSLMSDSSRILKNSKVIPSYFYKYEYTNPARTLIKFTNRDKILRCNVLNDTSEYYKYIYDETLVLSSSIKKLDLSNELSSENIAFGDTFYSKFRIMTKRPISNNNKFTDRTIKLSEMYDTVFVKNNTAYYILDAFVESKYNLHARYWEGSFPDWEQPINSSSQTGYSKTYNLQNTQNAISVKNINSNEDSESNIYQSRIVMSKTKSKESNVLNFRKYLALDYYDMPYNRNSIVALNSTYRNLYIQQELALSVASVKDIISYQDGSTYVGSGELFDRLPTEIIPTGYGFLGCSNYFNTGITDIGLWVIDSVQSLIALITDNDIKIISNGKNQNWFNNKLKGLNPFNNDGCFITYDNSNKQLKRLILTSPLISKSLSYYPQLENWFSFHDYKPKFGVYTRNNTYFIFDKIINSQTKLNLYKFDDSIKCKFNDSTNISKSIISLYFNDEPNINKLFEGIYWNTKFIIDNVDIYDKTFTELFVHNDSQCTNKIEIGLSTDWFDSENGVLKNELWIFNKLFDYVKNNKKPFLEDFVNFVNTNIDTTKEWFEISEIMSIFACVTMIFDNWYYSSDGLQKSNIVTENCNKQVNLMLNDLQFKYRKSNR